MPPNRYLNIEIMSIISSYDEEDYYDNINYVDYVNYYDGADDYYLDYYGYVDDDEIINCKKRITEQ